MDKHIRNKGITLIALVITIIILLILATITIVALTGDNGILGKAEEAKFKEELSRLQEELERFKLAKVSETQGEFEETTLSANKFWLYYEPVEYVADGTIKEVMPSISKEMQEKIEVLNGEILFSGSEKEVAWAKELGLNKIVKVENGVLLSDNDNLSILSEDGTFTVPSTVRVIGEGSFAKVEGIRKVIIPYTVSEIAQNAFQGNKTIEEVVFQTKEVNGEVKGVTKIGASAFSTCTALAKLDLPETLTTVQGNAFSGCNSLESVEIHSNWTSIGDAVFCNCTNLQTAKLPDTFTKIGYRFFDNCTKLNKVNFPESIKYIGAFAFRSCINLQEVILGDSVSEIGDGAFSSCEALKKIHLGKSVQKIGTDVFSNCKNLKVIDINSENTNFKFAGGVLLTGDGTQMIYILPSTIPKTQTEFSIPKGVTTLSGKFATDFPQVTKLIIPASVNSIDIENFLTNITRLEVDSVNETYLTENNNLYSKNKEILYYYLENNETVNLDKKVKVIQEKAFSSKSLTNVKTINLINDITTIGKNAFDGTTNLETINIGISVSNIDPLSFGYKTDANIIIDVNNDYYLYENKILYNKGKDKIIRYLGKSVETFAIPDGVSVIGENAFYNASAIKKLEMSDSVTELESSALCGCGLTEIKWSSNLTILGNSSLASNKFVNIEVPNGVTTIGEACFTNCSLLEKIKIPNSVNTIGSRCFYNCPKLTSVEIDKKKGEITGSPWQLTIGDRGIKWLR